MRNKYVKRGLLMLILGIGFNVLGWAIRDNEWGLYGWAMIIGVILFGIGFLSVLYGLIRKVERSAILEERAVAQQEAEASDSDKIPEK